MAACLEAAIPALDHIVLIDNGCSDMCKKMYNELFDSVLNNAIHNFSVRVVAAPEIKKFDELRNLCFKYTNVGDLILKLDADDVHYAKGLNECFQAMEKDESIGVVFAKFLHHRRDPFQHGGVHVKDIFFRQGKETKWQSGVHEGLTGLTGPALRTDYLYHHFGYCKSRSELLAHWINYDILEHGKITAYDVSGYEKVDPNKDLHGQFDPKHNVKYTGPWPKEVNWFFDNTLLDHGVRWTPTGLEGGDFDPLRAYIRS
jgi:hypothetical protein